ncbi:hypothetical protein CHU92_01310 [Flavobacterium cyanobacteriorum]|uniref:Cupin 2 conserved barrel domain-containing protein n=1 Tax=Flavobacterium cyanobacteriorum TaxID=2022802 RepID=A0A255ZZD4_9FLAO|nr:hypothetical protein [Flavobacterium cyanobacteriorum]OYQ46806.1 hypothetical protein CHU92_01310 [Flavobacterium cyanobacteriorum]
MKAFHITRVYADADGESHFEDIAIPLTDKGKIGFLSETQQGGTIIFRKVTGQYDYDFHNAPARQYIILLDGEIELEVSSDEKRKFTAGHVLLVEDTTGRGHRTRNVTLAERSSIFITL